MEGNVEMLGLFEAVINYFKKRKFKKYVTEINKFLDNIDKKQPSLDLALEKLKGQRTFITDQQLQGIKKDFGEEYEFAMADKFYAINNEAVSFFEKNKELLKSLDVFKKINDRYQQLRAKFLYTINISDELAKQTNYLITLNSNLVSEFYKEVAYLQEDYFTNTHFRRLSQRYVEPYSFFKEDKNNKDDRIVKFLDYYSNLKEHIKNWNYEYIHNIKKALPNSPCSLYGKLLTHDGSGK